MNDVEDSHRSLRLLEEISTGDELTQRDLSDRAGMALGLVNTYLKNLVAKGHVKISAIPPKRFKYYLTPKGFVEKSRLTYHILQNYTRVFREARRDFSALFHRLHAEGVRRVYFAGVDEVAEIAYLSLQEVDIEFMGAADTGRRGENFFKTAILGLYDLKDMAPGSRVVITSYNKRDAVYKSLAEAGLDMDAVESIYPLAGGRRAG